MKKNWTSYASLSKAHRVQQQQKGMKLSSLSSILLLCILLESSQSAAATFSCRSKSTCQSLIGYTSQNATTLLRIKSLFQVKSLRSLLAANGLPLATPASRPIPPGSTTRIRFTCRCFNGSGSASRGPVYKVKPGDGLDSIARNVFNGFVAFQAIAIANNISNPNLIAVGQRLRIPLPCSCDDVEGKKVVHYGHVVAMGSSVEAIGSEFGVSETVLLQVNGLKDPKELLAGQVLDVPLRACSSSISNTSLDRDLLVPNASYALTANNCVLCSCSSPSWQLDCRSTQGISSGSCPAAKCGNLYIGNTSSSSDCERSVCTYTGYTNTSILTNLTSQSLCNNSGAPILQTDGGSAQRQGMLGGEVLIFMHVFLIFASFL